MPPGTGVTCLSRSAFPDTSRGSCSFPRCWAWPHAQCPCTQLSSSGNVVPGHWPSLHMAWAGQSQGARMARAGEGPCPHSHSGLLETHFIRIPRPKPCWGHTLDSWDCELTPGEVPRAFSTSCSGPRWTADKPRHQFKKPPCPLDTKLGRIERENRAPGCAGWQTRPQPRWS